MIRFIIALMAAPCICLALDITNREGRVFSNATISRTEPDGISVRHSGGITKLFWAELPDDVVAKFNPDPEAARVYQRQQQQMQAEYFKAVQDAEKERRQPVVSTANKQQQNAQSQATKREVQGRVVRVMTDGLVLRDVAFPTKSMPNQTLLYMADAEDSYYESAGRKWKKQSQWIFVRCNPAGYTTGASFSGKISAAGTYTMGTSTMQAYNRE